MIKRLKKIMAGALAAASGGARAMNGEFIVFLLGLVLVTAGAGMIWGMGTAAIVAGGGLLGDVIFGRVVALKISIHNKKAGDE